jgi:hypothetical protein
VPELTVTLIHGTFARGASWTQAGSPLWQDLESRFGRAAVIDRFDWSGENSAFARLEASLELVEHLNKLRERFPTAKRYLVAHSHAGNVALYAAEQTRVDGVASLATPFLHASLRDKSLISEKAIQGGLFGTACLITYITDLIVNIGWINWLVAILLISVFSHIVAAFVSGTFGVVARTSTRFAEILTAKVPEDTAFCAFRVTGDEASLSLASGQLIAWFSTKLYAYFTKTKNLKFLTNPFRKRKIPKKYWHVPTTSLVIFLIGNVLSQKKLARWGRVVNTWKNWSCNLHAYIGVDEDDHFRQSALWHGIYSLVDCYANRNTSDWHATAEGICRHGCQKMVIRIWVLFGCRPLHRGDTVWRPVDDIPFCSTPEPGC